MILNGAGTHAAEIKLLCTNGVKGGMLELAPRFERTSGHTLVISYGAAAILAGRIKDGENADLAILTAAAIDELDGLGMVRGVRTDIARAGIGVAVRAGAPRPGIGTPDSFRRALLAANSIAYTTAGASGVYFAGLIERMGIADEVRAKAKLIAGGLAGELVASGVAELVVQQIPELKVVHGIDIVGPLPAELQHVTIFSAGLLANAKQAEASDALIRFLTTRAAKDVFHATGMEPD